MNDNTARLFFHLMTDDGAPPMMMPQPPEEIQRVYNAWQRVVNALAPHTFLWQEVKMIYIFADETFGGETAAMTLGYGTEGFIIAISQKEAQSEDAELIDTLIHELAHTESLWHDTEWHMIYGDLLKYWNKANPDLPLTDYYFSDIVRWDGIAKRK